MVASEKFWTGVWCSTCDAPLVSASDDVLRQHVLDAPAEHQSLLEWALDTPENLKKVEA